ncbi:MAG TPA: SDR family oxidoreductase, partial [Chitinophagaceae bacterium]|nr:SDR family oxidoreductase [Chitinophagaceae bacterium]
MEKSLQKKLAIITGGGSGIGLAIAEKFVAQGITTVIIGRDENKLNCAKEKLGELVKPVVADLTALSTLPGLVKKISKDHGHIDILVNNAGINQKKDFTEVSDEEFQEVMQT